jgi:hypothetical protein
MASGAQSGGFLSSVTNMLGGAAGEKVGALINGVAALKESGWTMEQIRQAGAAVLAHAKESADPKSVDQLLDSVPGLEQFMF